MQSRLHPPAGSARRRRPRAAAAALLGCAALAWATLAAAQQAVPVPSGRYTAAQLDQLLAPVALYPDDLLAQILMAAGYPLELIEADRWLKNPDNAGLRGMALAEALQQQPWDASVKSLAAFAPILSSLDDNLEWTEALGEAFIAQQAEVMDEVQQLRRRAQAARTLVATPQQQVTNDGPYVQIAPAAPDTVYVPVYDPNVVYGAWPYPDDAPFAFYVPGYPVGTSIGFAIIGPLWGWDQWNWRRHGLGVDGSWLGGGAGASGRPRRPVHPVPWRHDVSHRGGISYRIESIPAAMPGVARALPQDAGGASRPAPAAEGRGRENARPPAALPPVEGANRPAPGMPAAAPRPIAPAAEPRRQEPPIRGPEHRDAEPREPAGGERERH